LPLPRSGSYGIYLFYETLTVEQHIETLIYDVGAFLASAGGNLGQGPIL
jgi:hypothetical protein